MDTYAYIDGLNLYYGALKGTPYKWLDLKALCQRIFPRNRITNVKYFTARVQGTPEDPDQPTRQQILLRAFRHYIPSIEIIEGSFLRSRTRMPDAATGELVQVIKTEEKGSDVNLGVHLVNDAWKNLYEAAIVVSNDSDLAEAIRLVKEERGKPVGVLNPHMKGRGRPSIQLDRVASFRGRISVADLKASQMPDPITGTKIFKPTSW